MEARLEILFKKKEDYIILEKFPGEKLKGLKYKPLFSYYTQVNVVGNVVFKYIITNFIYVLNIIINFITVSKYCFYCFN